MIEFNFSEIKEIKKIHFTNDSSGYLINEKSNLFSFSGNTTKEIKTPEEFQINDLYFKNDSCGIIIGNYIPNHIKHYSTILEGRFSMTFFPIFLTFLLLVLKNKKTSKNILIFISLLLISSCSIFWKSKKTKVSENKTEIQFNNKRPAPFYSTLLSHNLLNYPEIDKINSFISTTNNFGQTWKTKKICNKYSCSNFLLTDVVFDGHNYLISTYGPNNHTDGDLYVLNNQNEYTLSVSRGVREIQTFKQNNSSYLIFYGSKEITKFPPNELSKTSGNIIITNNIYDSLYTIIKGPELEHDVTSLSFYTKNHFFASTSSGKLFEYKDEKWSPIIFFENILVSKILRDPKSENSFILTKNKECYILYANNNIEKLSVPDISELITSNNEIVIISKNRLHIY